MVHQGRLSQNKERHMLKSKASSRLIALSLVLNIFGLLSACSPSPEDLYQEGSRRLTQQRDYQGALRIFQQLNAEATEDIYKYRALYGQSQVHQRIGDLKAQSDLLNQILQNMKFSVYHEVVKEDLEENLLMRAKTEKSKQDPRQALTFYKRALELNAKSEARALLTEYLRAAGDEAMSERRLDEALNYYKEVRSLNISNETLLKSLDPKVEQILLAQYRLRVEKNFVKRLTDLTRTKIYDPKTKTFYFKVESYAIGRVNRKNQAEQEKVAKSAAAQLALQETARRVKMWFDLQREPQVNEALISFTKGEFARRTQRIKIDKRSTRVTPFSYYFTLPLGTVYQLAFQVAKDQAVPEAQQETTSGDPSKMPSSATQAQP